MSGPLPEGAQRERRRQAFVRAAGWADAVVEPLTGDASFRRYWRLRRGGRSLILMDAPPGRESAADFVAVAQLLRTAGLSAPAIHHAAADGFLLLEDFGDATFTRLLNQGADAHDLYALAVDALIVLRQRVQLSTLPTLRRLSAPVLLDQVELLTQWYLPLAGGGVPHESAAAAWRAAWTEVLAGRPAEPETLVLYDYHVDNLIRLTDRSAVAACGLLDFQDAVKGPALFDLVSLLRDVRRDVPPDLAQAMQARYRAAFAPMGDGDFDHAAALWALQRNCRILGTFARLCVRDGKPGYLAFLPRVWRLVAEDAAHPALSPVREWLDRHVPPPARHITPPEAGRG